ncbi:MAG: hypothetical protein ACD_3C00188G0009 [uncultured bacterium (gcode 4)]|uniref:2'-5' RNA ligase n=1 Tax=uncultured bacterium (gcode 4) TaxID=1234023 RepID=K2FXC2_9BACT|nr:MAG: hypothetical protein ACD_3C00188G0009 [uncultured bacterium (gcode 4)]
MNIFGSLQKIIEKNRLEKIVKLQNPTALHVTLYYFWKHLSEDDMIAIKDKIDTIRPNIKDGKLNLGDFRYFLHWNRAIFYLTPKTDLNLNGFNKAFEGLFHKETEENKLTYIPHITLFKVKDLKEYERFRPLFEKEVKWFLNDFWKLDYFENVNLYCVDSDNKPEMQKGMY